MKTLLLASVLAFTSFFGANAVTSTTAEGDAIIGKWLNQEGTSHIQIFKATNGSFAGKFYGKIVWLKEPLKNGKPKVDDLNPNPAKRSVPLMNLQILKDFVYDADDKEWEDGTIYDPKNGKTYSCYMTLSGNKLDVRGYVGISMIGRTSVWTRVQ
ncbi:MAG: hypothetical protein RL285_1094 [Bacteroidota bacterium]|jgi:uncharacterized protein (DUF2147 family)